jgi:hypothetical protein
MPDMDNQCCPDMTCPTETQAQNKSRVLKNGPNSYNQKNMRYSAYVNSTPGFETFANKKVVGVQATVAAKQLCFKNAICPATPIPYVNKYVPQAQPSLPLSRFNSRWIIGKAQN